MTAPADRTTPRRPRRRGHGAPLAACLLLVTSCAGGGEPPPAPAGGPEPEPVSQEEYRASATAFLDESARYAGEVVACAGEQGLELDHTWDFGFRLPPGVEGEDADAFWEVVHGCAEEIYPPERTLDDAEIEEHYRLLLAARECLEDAGFETSEPSGFGPFLEAYRSERVPWSPYGPVAADADLFRSAVEACPQPGRF